MTLAPDSRGSRSAVFPITSGRGDLLTEERSNSLWPPSCGLAVGELPALDAPAGHADTSDVPLAFALLLTALAVDWQGGTRGRRSVLPEGVRREAGYVPHRATTQPSRAARDVDSWSALPPPLDPSVSADRSSPNDVDQSTQPHSLPSAPPSVAGPRSSSADRQAVSGRPAAAVRTSVGLRSRDVSAAVERSMKATSTRSSGTPDE